MRLKVSERNQSAGSTLERACMNSREHWVYPLKIVTDDEEDEDVKMVRHNNIRIKCVKYRKLCMCIPLVSDVTT